MSAAVLALDQGTSATKALVVLADGSIAAEIEVPVALRAVGAGGVETEAEDIWTSVVSAGSAAVAQAGAELSAVALANQGETVLAWRYPTGEPLSPAIGWQDRRAASITDALASEREAARALSGLELDPYFSAPKMAWLRPQVPEDAVITTTDTWLIHRLTGSYVTDAATASRTLLLDLDKGEWSEELCAFFGVDMSALPRIVGNTDVVGRTRAFGSELPVVGTAVDQQAALFAEACFEPGQAKCTYGTGAFLLTNLGISSPRSKAGLATCVAWRIGDATTYCLDGQVYTAGSAVSWLVSAGILASAADVDGLVMGARQASSPRTPYRPEIFVPALSGLAAPYWAPQARGGWVGLGLDTDRAALVQAVIEGIAANVTHLARVGMHDVGFPIARLRADGGLVRSAALMQAQADLLQVPVDVYSTPHATALGVAALARIGLGHAATPRDAVSAWTPSVTYEPGCSAGEAEHRMARWLQAADAVAQGLGAAETRG
ncbi:MAG: FGGY family carbohydrate kinase [Acidimicrobiales bacterium]